MRNWRDRQQKYRQSNTRLYKKVSGKYNSKKRSKKYEKQKENRKTFTFYNIFITILSAKYYNFINLQFFFFFVIFAH